MKRLFPPYLDAGSNGTAVDVLHAILCMLGYGENIKRDGVYGPETVKAVKKLQLDLGFKGDEEVDGNFGPATRELVRTELKLNIEAIPFSSLYDQENTWRGPDTEGDQIWTGK